MDIVIANNSSNIALMNARANAKNANEQLKRERTEYEESRLQLKQKIQSQMKHITKLEEQMSTAKDKLTILSGVKVGLANEISTQKTGSTQLEQQNTKLRRIAKRWEGIAKQEKSKLEVTFVFSRLILQIQLGTPSNPCQRTRNL